MHEADLGIRARLRRLRGAHHVIVASRFPGPPDAGKNAAFCRACFTDKERAFCEAKGVASAQSFAARFAAKEACLKALQTGWRGRITWHDIEICSNETGVPSLEISGEAKKILENLGANKIHLSMSHTGEHAIAQVILEKI